MTISIRKFKDAQDYLSASDLMAMLLIKTQDAKNLLSIDLKEKHQPAFQFDSGYLAALNDIMYQLMLMSSDNNEKGDNDE